MPNLSKAKNTRAFTKGGKQQTTARESLSRQSSTRSTASSTASTARPGRVPSTLQQSEPTTASNRKVHLPLARDQSFLMDLSLLLEETPSSRRAPQHPSPRAQIPSCSMSPRRITKPRSSSIASSTTLTTTTTPSMAVFATIMDDERRFSVMTFEESVLLASSMMEPPLEVESASAEVERAATRSIRYHLRECLRRARLAVVRRSRSLRRPSVDMLCRNAAFACFPPAMVEQMTSAMTLEVHFAGEVLVHEGSRDRSCCWLLRGSARTVMGDQPFATVQEGSVLGAEGFCYGAAHEMGAVARQCCVVWRLRRRSVERMSREERIQRDHFFASHRRVLDVDSLRSISCFMFLSAEALRTMSLNATPMIFPSSSEVCVPADAFVLVLRGTVHVTNSRVDDLDFDDEEDVKREMEFCFHVAQSLADISTATAEGTGLDVCDLFDTVQAPRPTMSFMTSFRRAPGAAGDEGARRGDGSCAERREKGSGTLRLKGLCAIGVGPAVYGQDGMPPSITVHAAPRRKHDVEALVIHTSTVAASVLSLVRKAVPQRRGKRGEQGTVVGPSTGALTSPPLRPCPPSGPAPPPSSPARSQLSNSLNVTNTPRAVESSTVRTANEPLSAAALPLHPTLSSPKTVPLHPSQGLAGSVSSKSMSTAGLTVSSVRGGGVGMRTDIAPSAEDCLTRSGEGVLAQLWTVLCVTSDSCPRDRETKEVDNTKLRTAGAVGGWEAPGLVPPSSVCVFRCSSSSPRNHHLESDDNNHSSSQHLYANTDDGSSSFLTLLGSVTSVAQPTLGTSTAMRGAAVKTAQALRQVGHANSDSSAFPRPQGGGGPPPPTTSTMALSRVGVIMTTASSSPPPPRGKGDARAKSAKPRK